MGNGDSILIYTKMKTFFLLVLLWPFVSSAQRMVDLNYVQDAKGNYTFSCTNKGYCNYILQVVFTTLDNAKCDRSLPYEEVVKPGTTRLFRLTKEDAGKDILLKYKYSSWKGCIDPPVDTGFTYILPIAPGKEAQAYEISNTSSRTLADGTVTRNFYAIRLRMKPGDTLYAARRGVVCNMNVSSGQNDAGVAVTDGDNFVEIAHGDCSFGLYGILKKDGAFVHPGQTVEAGQPIGLIGGDRFGRGSDARFSVTYNRMGENGSSGGGGGGTAVGGASSGNGGGAGGGSTVGTGDGKTVLYTVYVPLKFWTKKNGKGMLKHGGTYTSECPPAILTQELPKPAPKKKTARPAAKTH